ncbi:MULTISPECIES: hypothetical protein [unclassified Microbacterium]|uniref:hypothetical protein n=1 Tax=unclassified Microbacterium TaxID=2609290 RepID=UPI003018F0A1
MDPVKAGWRISNLVAYDTAAAEAIAKIADASAHVEGASIAETVEAIRGELRVLTNGAAP